MYAFSQMKYIKHIEPSFIPSPWSCQRGGTWGSWESNPSIRPSRYLLLNQRTKSHQIWSVSYSQEWSVQQLISALPPVALRRDKKVKTLNFNNNVNFKDVYAFSQINDIKHIEQSFIPSPGSCHRGGTWGSWG